MWNENVGPDDLIGVAKLSAKEARRRQSEGPKWYNLSDAQGMPGAGQLRIVMESVALEGDEAGGGGSGGSGGGGGGGAGAAGADVAAAVGGGGARPLAAVSSGVASLSFEFTAARGLRLGGAGLLGGGAAIYALAKLEVSGRGSERASDVLHDDIFVAGHGS